MKKLHVKDGEQWKMVFCYMNHSKEIIKTDDVSKALPQEEIHAESDLEFFSKKFGNYEFALFEVSDE